MRRAEAREAGRDSDWIPLGFGTGYLLDSGLDPSWIRDWIPLGFGTGYLLDSGLDPSWIRDWIPLGFGTGYLLDSGLDTSWIQIGYLLSSMSQTVVMVNPLHDVIVVGAGPAGLTAGMYCARGGRKTLILGNIYGSQQSMGGLYENYPGFPDGIQGIELSERMLAQAQKFGAEYQTDMVQKIVHLGDMFRLKTENWQYEAKVLILATGASPRKLGVPGEAEYATRGVSYCVHCDGALFRNKTVAVVGYGNGAARAALHLSVICSKVHLLCPKEKLVAEAVYLEKLKGLENLSAIFGAEVTGVLGDASLSSIEFRVGNTPRSLKLDGVFVEMGVKPNTELAEALGLELNRFGFIKVNRLTQETSMTGILAAGDATGGRMQVATAVGSGASAAISAMRYLDEKWQGQ